MEEEDNIIVKWAQEDAETSYNLQNNNNFSLFEYPAFSEIMLKSVVEPTDNRIQYGVCTFHAGYLRLQIHIQNM